LFRASYFELTCVLAALAERNRKADERSRTQVMSDEQTADFFEALAAATKPREKRRA